MSVGFWGVAEPPQEPRLGGFDFPGVVDPPRAIFLLAVFGLMTVEKW